MIYIPLATATAGITAAFPPAANNFAVPPAAGRSSCAISEILSYQASHSFNVTNTPNRDNLESVFFPLRPTRLCDTRTRVHKGGSTREIARERRATDCLLKEPEIRRLTSSRDRTLVGIRLNWDKTTRQARRDQFTDIFYYSIALILIFR